MNEYSHAVLYYNCYNTSTVQHTIIVYLQFRVLTVYSMIVRMSTYAFVCMDRLMNALVYSYVYALPII